MAEVICRRQGIGGSILASGAASEPGTSKELDAGDGTSGGKRRGIAAELRHALRSRNDRGRQTATLGHADALRCRGSRDVSGGGSAESEGATERAVHESRQRRIEYAFSAVPKFGTLKHDRDRGHTERRSSASTICHETR